MQIHYFPNNGFVIHKAINGQVSAWFDAAGTLLDCEKRTSNDRMRQPSQVTKEYLRAMGRAWVRRVCIKAQG